MGAEARLPPPTIPTSCQEREEDKTRSRSIGGGEGRRRGVGSLWSKSSPGPGACTDSNYTKTFQLQYRQEVQGKAQSQGGQGVRVGGRGGDGGVGDSGSLVSWLSLLGCHGDSLGWSSVHLVTF